MRIAVAAGRAPPRARAGAALEAALPAEAELQMKRMARMAMAAAPTPPPPPPPRTADTPARAREGGTAAAPRTPPRDDQGPAKGGGGARRAEAGDAAARGGGNDNDNDDDDGPGKVQKAAVAAEDRGGRAPGATGAQTWPCKRARSSRAAKSRARPLKVARSDTRTPTEDARMRRAHGVTPVPGKKVEITSPRAGTRKGVVDELRGDFARVRFEDGSLLWENRRACRVVGTVRRRNDHRRSSPQSPSTKSTRSTASIAPPPQGRSARAARRESMRAQTQKVGVLSKACADVADAWKTARRRNPGADPHNADAQLPVGGLPVSGVRYFTSETLPNRVADVLFKMTRSNMKPLYESVKDAPSAWDDAKKQQELFCQSNMLFLVVYSDEVEVVPQSADETDPLSVSADVLSRIVDRIVDDHEETSRLQQQQHGGEAEAGVPHLRPDQIIGFVAFKTYCEAARWSLLYIHELQLVPEVRGRGIGAYLMANLEEIAHKYGSVFLMLTVQDVNVGARRFYEKGGFSVDEACPSVCYQSEKVSYRIMSKMLDPRILRNACVLCKDACFRYPESLTIHNCKLHGEQWPFRCRHPSCGLGTVKREQLRQHMQQHEEGSGAGGGAASQDTGSASARSFGLPAKMREDSSEGSEASASQGARRVARAADLLCQRVTLLSSGQAGMVVKTSGNTYTVRLDGDPPETRSLRRSDFVVQVPQTRDALLRCVAGPDEAQIDPNKLLPPVVERKKKDPDFLYAMALHYQEEGRHKRRRQVGVSS